MTDKEIRSRVKSLLSPARFRHTLSVARLARELALCHGENPRKAYLAGLLHDCAKELSSAVLDQIMRRHNLWAPDKKFIRAQKHLSLFHAYVSAYHARRDFGVMDRAVLSAIAAHTLGAPRMSALDTILYVADFAAPERGFKAAHDVRLLAKSDLAAAFRESLRWKMSHVLKAGRAIHPQTLALWNGLCLRGKTP